MQHRVRLGSSSELVIVGTDRSHGDFAVGSEGISARRQELVNCGPWTWLQLEHGARVIRVDSPGQHAGAIADAAVTRQRFAPLAITAADCVPVVLGVQARNKRTGFDDAAIGVAHAGWRGLLAGVVEATANGIHALFGDEWEVEKRFAFCGPSIGPEDYAFADRDAAPLVARYGDSVMAETRFGGSALDVFEGVRAALQSSGFPTPSRPPSTVGDSFYSHRIRADPERMVTVAFLDATMAL
ncbi:MAG: polyphenol oxidase family protein [Acidimicrobiales bacterium]|nr:polyphenol oxidase family protein [Acidimicrobiales bacterium]